MYGVVVSDRRRVAARASVTSRLQAIPFVFYTATYTDTRDEELALNLGAARFIVKPIDGQAFVAIVRDVLKDYDAGRLAVGTAVPAEETVYYRLYNEVLIRKLETRWLDYGQRCGWPSRAAGVASQPAHHQQSLHRTHATLGL